MNLFITKELKKKRNNKKQETKTNLRICELTEL